MDKPTKSVLIITYNMIPYSPEWGSCQRMYFLAEYLQNKGYDVTVIYSMGKYYGDFGKPANFHLIPVGLASISPIETISSVKGKIVQITTKNAKNILNIFNIKSLEKLIFNDANPWMGIIGYLFARNARACITKTIIERSIDFVIISGPPFTLFHLAPLIKNNFPYVKIIFDYRDPWNLPNSTYISTLIEKKYLKFADKVVFHNDRVLKDTMQIYGLSENNCEIVLNGYSKNDWNEVEKNFRESQLNPLPKKDKMIISNIGGIHLGKGGYRDLTLFFDSFEKAIELFPQKKILIRFVGVLPSKEAEELKKRFNKNIEIIPPVSLQSSLIYMLKSDVLLLIHSSNTGRYIQTGKIFDYIKSGKVIFGIGKNKDTYFLDLINKYNLGIGCLNQSSEILRSLEILYDHWEYGSLNQLRQDVELNIEDFSRDTQNYKYLKILQKFEQIN